MSNETPLHITHALLSRGFARSKLSTSTSCNQYSESHTATLSMQKGHPKNELRAADHRHKEKKTCQTPTKSTYLKTTTPQK